MRRDNKNTQQQQSESTESITPESLEGVSSIGQEPVVLSHLNVTDKTTLFIYKTGRSVPVFNYAKVFRNQIWEIDKLESVKVRESELTKINHQIFEYRFKRYVDPICMAIAEFIEMMPANEKESLSIHSFHAYRDVPIHSPNEQLKFPNIFHLIDRLGDILNRSFQDEFRLPQYKRPNFGRCGVLQYVVENTHLKHSVTLQAADPSLDAVSEHLTDAFNAGSHSKKKEDFHAALLEIQNQLDCDPYSLDSRNKFYRPFSQTAPRHEPWRVGARDGSGAMSIIELFNRLILHDQHEPCELSFVPTPHTYRNLNSLNKVITTANELFNQQHLIRQAKTYEELIALPLPDFPNPQEVFDEVFEIDSVPYSEIMTLTGSSFPGVAFCDPISKTTFNSFMDLIRFLNKVHDFKQWAFDARDRKKEDSEAIIYAFTSNNPVKGLARFCKHSFGEFDPTSLRLGQRSEYVQAGDASMPYDQDTTVEGRIQVLGRMCIAYFGGIPKAPPPAGHPFWRQHFGRHIDSEIVYNALDLCQSITARSTGEVPLNSHTAVTTAFQKLAEIDFNSLKQGQDQELPAPINVLSKNNKTIVKNAGALRALKDQLENGRFCLDDFNAAHHSIQVLASKTNSFVEIRKSMQSALDRYLEEKLEPTSEFFNSFVSSLSKTERANISTDTRFEEPIYDSNGEVLFDSFAHFLRFVAKARALKAGTLRAFENLSPYHLGSPFDPKEIAAISPLKTLKMLCDELPEGTTRQIVDDRANLHVAGITRTQESMNKGSYKETDFPYALEILGSVISQLSTDGNPPSYESIELLLVEDSKKPDCQVRLIHVLYCIGQIGLNEHSSSESTKKNAYRYGCDLVEAINGKRGDKPFLDATRPIELITNQETIIVLEALQGTKNQKPASPELNALNDFIGSLSKEERQQLTTRSFRHVKFSSPDRTVTYTGIGELARAAAMTLPREQFGSVSAGELIEDLTGHRRQIGLRFDYHLPELPGLFGKPTIDDKSSRAFAYVISEALRQHYGEGFGELPPLSDPFWSLRLKVEIEEKSRTITPGEALSAFFKTKKCIDTHLKFFLEYIGPSKPYTPEILSEKIIDVASNRSILLHHAVRKRSTAPAVVIGETRIVENLDQLRDVMIALDEDEDLRSLFNATFDSELSALTDPQLSIADCRAKLRNLNHSLMRWFEEQENVFIEAFRSVTESIQKERRYNITDRNYEYSIVSEAGWVEFNSLSQFLEIYSTWSEARSKLKGNFKAYASRLIECKKKSAEEELLPSFSPSKSNSQKRSTRIRSPLRIVNHLSKLTGLSGDKKTESITWSDNPKELIDPYAVSLGNSTDDVPGIIVSSPCSTFKSSIDLSYSRGREVISPLWKEEHYFKSNAASYDGFETTVRDEFILHYKTPLVQIALNIIDLLPPDQRSKPTTGIFLGKKIYSSNGFVLFESFQALCNEIDTLVRMEEKGIIGAFTTSEHYYVSESFASDGLNSIVPTSKRMSIYAGSVDIELSPISTKELTDYMNSSPSSRDVLVRSLTEALLQRFGEIPSRYKHIDSSFWQLEARWINQRINVQMSHLESKLYDILEKEDRHTAIEVQLLRACRAYYRKHVQEKPSRAPVHFTAKQSEAQRYTVPLTTYLDESDGLLFKALVLLGWEKDSQKEFKKFKTGGKNQYRIAPEEDRAKGPLKGSKQGDEVSPVKAYIHALEGSLLAENNVDLTELGLVAHEELLTELCRFHYNGDSERLIKELKTAQSYIDSKLPQTVREKVQEVLASISSRIADRFKSEQEIVIPETIKKKPGAHQISLISDYIHRGKKIIASEMGTGKTRAAATLCEMLDVDRVLWISKANGRIPTYDELCATIDLPEDQFVIIPPDVSGKSVAEVEQFIGNAKYVIVANETLRACLSENNPEMHKFLVTCQGENGAVVIDEYHLFDNPTSHRSLALDGLIGKHTIALSGSLYQNRAERVATLVHRLEPEMYPDRAALTERCKDPIYLRALIARHVSVCFMSDIAAEFKPFSEVSAVEQLSSGVLHIPKVIKEEPLKIPMSEERARIYLQIALFFERFAAENPELLASAKKSKKQDLDEEIAHEEEAQKLDNKSLRQLILMQRALFDPEKLGLSPALDYLAGLKQRLIPELKSGKKILLFDVHKSMTRLLSQDADLKSFGLITLDGSTNVDDRAILRKQAENDPSVQVIVAQFDAEGTSSQIRGVDMVVNVELPKLFATYKQSLCRPIRLISVEDAHLARDVVKQLNVIQVLPESVLKEIDDPKILEALKGTLAEAHAQRINDQEEVFEYIMRRAGKSEAPASTKVKEYLTSLVSAASNSVKKEKIWDRLRIKLRERYENPIKERRHLNQSQYLETHSNIIDPKSSNVLLLAGPYGLEIPVYDKAGFPRSNLHCVEGGDILERKIFSETMATSGTHSYLGRLGEIVHHLPEMGVISIDSDGPVTKEYLEACRNIRLRTDSPVIVFKNTLSQRENAESKILLNAVSDYEISLERRRELLDARLFNLLGTAGAHEFGHLTGTQALRVYSHARHLSRELARALSVSNLQNRINEETIASFACSAYLGSPFIRDYRRFRYTSASGQPFSSVFAVVEAFKEEDRKAPLASIVRSIISKGIKEINATGVRKVDCGFIMAFKKKGVIHFLAGDSAIGSISEAEFLAEFNSFSLRSLPIAPFRNDDIFTGLHSSAHTHHSWGDVLEQ